MVTYICDLCEKVFNHKSTYLRHINRKNKCKPKTKNNVKNENGIIYSQNGINIPKMEYYNSTICIYCKKSYSTVYNLNKHKKKCKFKKDTDKKEELLELLKLEIKTDIEKENLFLKHQINNLQKELEVKINKTTNINYNINNTNCNNKTINILAYDKTDLSHLSDKDYESIMKKCFNCVPSFIKEAHFNPLKPENKNLYISNIKQNFIMKYNGEKWILSKQEDTLNELYENSSNILEDKIEDWEINKYKYDPTAVEKFYKFLEIKDKDTFKNKIKDDIKLILYNNKID